MSPIEILGDIEGNPSSYPTLLDLNLDIMTPDPDYHSKTDLIGFWTKVDYAQNMVLPLSDGDPAPTLITAPEAIGLKRMYREKIKTYCSSPNNIDSRDATVPTEFLIPDGVGWVYNLIVTEYGPQIS